ncbi:type II toxin-antitoxin system ParD family antitoxin [Brevundimonas sp.]|jgi:antitoxin ParD1/3/4|uniref:type II toxin-antitoxin system ParD family antitoxin n=1 Tax=Brevundimonas sp. TaxID=1871086 RepID=UPI002E153E89|nr:type II toxin-antitoxin system ParD family antitoxin [Brevundimonas sp.]
MDSQPFPLSPALDEYVDQKVRSGEFRDRAEVVAEALDRMREEDVRMDRLRQAINSGLDQLDAGEGIRVDDVEAWLDGLGH